MNRYLFIGSVEYSAHCLKALLEMGTNITAIMCPYEEAARFNSDYYDLGKVAVDFGKRVHYFNKISEEKDFIRREYPDVIFILGLSQIIPEKILSIPKIGCIGSHPSLLPQNRGRHPIIWAIANGLEKSGISLFWMDEGVDSGDIWGQKEFNIDMLDNASTVYRRIERLSAEILKENIPDLEKGVVKKIRQNSSLANYWRKRVKVDGQIDWRMSSKRIYDLVRALTMPYPGAHCLLRDREHKIWKTAIVEDAEKFQHLEPGRVISTQPRLRIKTGDGAIDILEHDIHPRPDVGDCL